jgi:hypothetical protein
MLRNQGHDVRTAVRLTDDLAEWAEGLVRFAPYPGPPGRDEANWYREWLRENPNRWLIYVVRDFDATAEYWREVRAHLSASEDPERVTEAEEARDKAGNWAEHLPVKASEAGDPKQWFKLEPAWFPPRTISKLSGPWATGIDGKAAALMVHEPLHESGGHVLLMGDDKPFVIEKRIDGEGHVLIIANGSFLLNEPLTNSARRPLAERVVNWAGKEGRAVALVEGSFVLDGPHGPPSLWDLVKRLPALRWAAIQLSLAGLLAALARAPRLGRPKPDPDSDADQPGAHARALGDLLARTGSAQDAVDLLDRYRRWRFPRSRENITPPPPTTLLAGEAPAAPSSPHRNAPNG